MDKHQEIIAKLKAKYQSDDSVLALLLVGGVARGDYTSESDLDLILITKNPTEEHYEEHVDDGITVEIKKSDLSGFVDKMRAQPIEVYQYLEAKAVFDNADCLQELKAVAEEVIQNYTSGYSRQLKKWLTSVRTKIISAQQSDDRLKLGFHISNVLWKVTQAFFEINKMPTPASSSALRLLPTLKILPDDFAKKLEQALTADLDSRTLATLDLIDFCLDRFELQAQAWLEGANDDKISGVRTT